MAVRYLHPLGYRVGQVRMIFQLRVPESHPLHQIALAYVYWFTEIQRVPERDLNMYKVRYEREPDGLRIGAVVKLSRLSRLVQMIPVYGAQVNPDLTSENSMDVWRDYYLNSFMDKETYQSVW